MYGLFLDAVGRSGRGLFLKVLPGIVLLNVSVTSHRTAQMTEWPRVPLKAASPSSRTRRVSHPGREVRGGPVHLGYLGTEFTPLKRNYLSTML